MGQSFSKLHPVAYGCLRSQAALLLNLKTTRKENTSLLYRPGECLVKFLIVCLSWDLIQNAMLIVGLILKVGSQLLNSTLSKDALEGSSANLWSLWHSAYYYYIYYYSSEMLELSPQDEGWGWNSVVEDKGGQEGGEGNGKKKQVISFCSYFLQTYACLFFHSQIGLLNLRVKKRKETVISGKSQWPTYKRFKRYKQQKEHHRAEELLLYLKKKRWAFVLSQVVFKFPREIKI